MAKKKQIKTENIMIFLSVMSLIIAGYQLHLNKQQLELVKNKQ